MPEVGKNAQAQTEVVALDTDKLKQIGRHIRRWAPSVLQVAAESEEDDWLLIK